MVASCRILAPAKINIGLAVSPGTDGYHNIESVFQTIDLCDEIAVERMDEAGVVVRCAGMDIPEQNTLTAAYSFFCAELGARAFGARVSLTKRIPQGAGLGGGSSDAAAFVRALEMIHGTALDRAARMRIASRVGSDVFFFMAALSATDTGHSTAAVINGRGENVKLVDARSDLFLALVYPDVSVSTREAFALLDAENGGYDAEKHPRLDELEAMYHTDVRLWQFVNGFTKPISRAFPGIARALHDVRETGALFADMSGSGASVFGVFDSRKTAENAVCRLKQKWERCWAIQTAAINGGTHADYGDTDS